jgi:hypothetical protein
MDSPATVLAALVNFLDKEDLGSLNDQEEYKKLRDRAGYALRNHG